ncbi:DUF397 domain-containing protein [Streptantibioticus rubrisoli]|uniref:DUF397 domain-containing protein n=1 Tax=Streptantibioticus rubrisoli TaxID=1387313 RepID=A0ABT1PDY7_9ACTN|nr:DUF397 domain-containing protein [Streptantibioticus rubrisoli]MCQ4042448.1 DUF397 domain-containing protein [Streptantibioticus rubrisoli]
MSNAQNTDTAIWITSSYSSSNGGQCVEVAAQPSGVRVRDSKDPAGPVLTFKASAWAQFADAVKSGELSTS